MDFKKLTKLNILAGKLQDMELELKNINNATEVRLVTYCNGECHLIDDKLFHEAMGAKYRGLIIDEMTQIYESKKRKFEAM